MQSTLSVTTKPRAEDSTPHDFRLVDVIGLHSIAHLFPKSKGRRGIYILGFRNGDRYVGQAVDVAIRFRSHRLRFGDDLISLAFRKVRTGDLDMMEKEAIRGLETLRVPLRNVVHTGGRLQADDFDALVSPDEQRLWLAAPRSGIATADRRVEQPMLRHRQAERFVRLTTDPRFAAFREPLRRYVAGAIPFPARTELTYWSLSAVPSTNAGWYPRLFTLSVQILETFFVYAPKDDPDLVTFTLNVDLPTLLTAWGSLDRLQQHLPWLVAVEGRYRARPGVVSLIAYGARPAGRLLATRGVLSAARRLNLDLMRKGPTMHWRSHCFDLADLVAG